MKNLRRILPPLSSLLPFEAAARLVSMTKAGEELGLTQAAVSKQIRALEADLGVALFERRNRAVFLTEEGKAYGAGLSDALQSIAKLSQELRARDKAGEVVLRAQLCEGLYWLMPRVSGFYEQHPQVPVRISVSTKPITEAEESYDLALQTASRDCGAAVEVFTATDRVFPICSPNYLARLGARPDIARLGHYRLLHHKVEPQDWIDWDTWLTRLGLPISIAGQGVAYDSYPMMIQAVIEGHGIALGWHRTVEKYLATGAIVRPFGERLFLPDGLSIYAPDKRPLREGAPELLAWLQGELS